MEIVVFGKEAGRNAATFALSEQRKTRQILDTDILIDEIKEFKNELDFYPLRAEVGDLFYKNVGIVRKKKELEFAYERIKELKSQIRLMGVSDTSKVYNTNLIEFLEFQNMLDICEIVVRSAIKREVSCGAHFREE